MDIRGSGEGREREKEDRKVGLEEEDGAIRRRAGENGVTNRRQTDGHYLFKDMKVKVGGAR